MGSALDEEKLSIYLFVATILLNSYGVGVISAPGVGVAG